MSSKYSTKQHISAQYCAKRMSEIWCKSIQAFLRYSNFRVGIFYFASPCTPLPDPGIARHSTYRAASGVDFRQSNGISRESRVCRRKQCVRGDERRICTEDRANCSRLQLGNNLFRSSVFGICRLQQRLV